jgi:hypothetical protein
MNFRASLAVFCLAVPLCGQDAKSDSTLEFENAWVRVVRVHYDAHEKTAMHDHPSTPTVYVYVTDGGRLRIGHDGEPPVIRPPVKAGGIRFQRGVAERHIVEELDGVASEYVRIELKNEPVDLPEQDVRRAPADTAPYDGGMIRIERITCDASSTCPASEHPERPAVVVTGREVRWVDAGASPIVNSAEHAINQVRVELKTKPRS